MTIISSTRRYIFTFAAIATILCAVDMLTGDRYENPFIAVGVILKFVATNPEIFIAKHTLLLFASALVAAIPAALIVVAFAVIGRLVGRATTGLAGLTSETGGKFGTLSLAFVAMLLVIYSQYPFFGPLY